MIPQRRRGVSVNHASSGLSAVLWKAEAGAIKSISSANYFSCDRLIDIKELIKLTGDSRSGAYEK